MSTHSPAPWRYCPKTGQIVDANNRQVARVWNTSNRERDHANGELIASAPMCQLAEELSAPQPKPLNLDGPFILSYEPQDDPGYKHGIEVASLQEARDYLNHYADMIVWAELSDADGNVVAGTDDLI